MKRTSALAFVVAAAACSSPPAVPPGACAAQNITYDSRFPAGSAAGHADPAGAKAAGQARAGRITQAAQIRQPANARQQVRVGDYLLANDRIALYIEDAGDSDGYDPFGGEILGIEPVADDGLPGGFSQYNETLMMLSRQVVAPESVTVLADGSDGGPAIVRASGVLKNIPFMETFATLLPNEFNLPAALDYVLEPHAEKVVLRLSLMNPERAPVDFAGMQNLGFFHYARSQSFTDGAGYAMSSGSTPWVAFDAGSSAFAWRQVGTSLSHVIDVSGFQLFQGSGLMLDGCASKTVDYAELIPGRTLDDARAAMRRTDGTDDWRVVTGTVHDGAGAPIAGAYVSEVDGDGFKVLTRVMTAADGTFTLHAPPRDVTLKPYSPGHPDATPQPLAPAATTAALAFPPNGVIVVHARDAADDTPLPVRVQVIPATAPTPPPSRFGLPDQTNGRIHQEFATDGEATLPVPPGDHRVVVSRGYEWELFDQTVTVASGQTVTLTAPLVHSVDSTGWMCADFHIHSYYSADSSDTVEHKIRGAIADGLEIPVSSEHEWIIDFQPIIEQLGLKKWAFGFPSEEFTTFSWGHFGIIPILPRDTAVNRGAIIWYGKQPPEIFAQINALPEHPVLIVNHPSGTGFGAYFSSVKFDRATASGDPEMWSEQFQAIEVFNGSSFDDNRARSVGDWFAMLDAGKVRWAVGNSDSHHLRSEAVGYPRTCFQFGHDDPTRLTADVVRDQLAVGAAVVSGGLFLTVSGPGGAGPGAMLPPQTGAVPFDVTVQAPSWLAASELEVIVDGETASTLTLTPDAGPGPARRYTVPVMVTPTSTRVVHYVIFHARGAADLAPLDPGRKAFAVSNPIFF
jgi:hypothetical protein